MQAIDHVAFYVDNLRLFTFLFIRHSSIDTKSQLTPLPVPFILSKSDIWVYHKGR